MKDLTEEEIQKREKNIETAIQKLQGEEVLKKVVMQILEKHHIKMKIDACGCCGSPIISFEYNGKELLKDKEYFDFDMYDEKTNPGESNGISTS